MNREKEKLRKSLVQQKKISLALTAIIGASLLIDLIFFPGVGILLILSLVGYLLLIIFKFSLPQIEQKIHDLENS